MAALIVPAFSQSIAPTIVQGTFLGMDDTDPSLSIGNEAQSALNVETSLNGSSLLKRSGYAKTASLTISTSPATGAYSFVDANGNKQQVVCQDHNCAKSTNNAAFSVFLSTAGGACMPTRWQFAQISGNLYAVNDCHDVPWKYDGTNRTPLPTAPLASIIEATKDRLVMSGATADPSAAYYSQSGTPSNFTVGINSADPYVDETGAQGDQVRALKYAIGRLFVFKTNSITSCILGDQYTSKCFPVSNTVGTVDPLSIIEIPGTYAQNGMLTSGAILFRGSDTNYWQLDQTGLNVISRKISNLVASQTSGSNQSNTQTSQSDWQAGTQLPASSWNTVTNAGSVFPSSVTLTDNSSTTFSAGTLAGIDAISIPGVITLSSTVFQDNFADGNFTSNPKWTDVLGNFNVTAGVLTNTVGSGSIYVNQGISTGSFSFQTTAFPNSGNITDTKFISSCNTLAGCGGYSLAVEHGGSVTSNIYLKRWPAGTVLVSSAITPSNGPDNLNTYIVQRSSAGDFLVYQGSTSTLAIISTNDTTYSTSTYMVSDCTSGNCKWTNFNFLSYSTFGVITSRIFDTGFSTPTGGPISFSSISVPSGTFLNFSVRSSSSPNNDKWTGWSSIANSAQITQTNRYYQYISTFTTNYSTQTPVINSVSLIAATTGQFVQQCVQPGSAITAWGILSCAQTLTGNGSEVFYATSAATCAALPTQFPIKADGTTQFGWTAQTNNANLSISTNAALFIGWRSLLTSATDQAQIDACTVYWTNGVASPPSWGTYDPVKNAAYWTASINNSATANRVLKYDLNLNEWYPFGLNATALYRDQNNNSIYFGDSSAGNWNKYGGVSSDAGAAINAYWIGRDIGSQAGPFVDNSFNRISVVAKNQVTGSMNLTATLSNNTSQVYAVSLSTTSGIVYIHGNYSILKASPYQFLNIQLGNNSTTPFEVDALSLDMSSWGWKAQNP